MDGRAYLRSLLEYNAWANEELFDKVEALPPEEVTKKRETILESIHRSLNHLLTVDIIWHTHMEKRAHAISQLRAILERSVNQAGVLRTGIAAVIRRHAIGQVAGR